MKSKIRNLEVSVISDVHLATHASKAKTLLKYLKSIQPRILVLNGDIIDSWRFSRNYFPKSHLKVIRYLIKMLEKGIRIFYITGNHDEFLRKFNGSEMGNLRIVNQLILELDGQKTWIFHGDIFDHIIHRAKWLAKLGATVYGFLTLINKGLNSMLRMLRLKEVIIYKNIKKWLVKEKPKLTRFEQEISKVVSSKNYQTVICGHTHVPKDKWIMNNENGFHYINCGDWVEHLTAAEYRNGKWQLFHFIDDKDDSAIDDNDIPDKKELYKSLLHELAIANVL